MWASPHPLSLKENFRVLKSEHEGIMGDGFELCLPILKGKLLVNVIAYVHNELSSKNCRIVCNTSFITNSLDEIK